MVYNDGVKSDTYSKVTICPRCQNEVFASNAEYCKICGLKLYNYCVGQIIPDPIGTYPERIENHKNDTDARYCETCGNITSFFEDNLLNEWPQAKSEIESEDEDEDEDEDVLF